MTQGPGASRPRARCRSALLLPLVLLCFGVLGLLWLLPAWRRRRTARGSPEPRWARTAAVAVLAVVLGAGAVTRAHTALRPPELCHSRIAPGGQVTPEPLLPAATAGTPLWRAVRGVVVAPTSGLALLAARAAGQHSCSGPPFTVTFSWPPSDSGGSTVGDTFVTWMPSDLHEREHHQRLRGTGLSSETPSVRFGPNLPGDRLTEQRLAEHETRHLDQWAVFTIAGGPLAFPLMYWADSLVFPGSRSHFERDAGLAEGGYQEPDGTGPAPLWGPLACLLVVGLLVVRPRGRRLSRGTDRVSASTTRGVQRTGSAPVAAVRAPASKGVLAGPG